MNGSPRKFLCLEKTSALGHVELEGPELGPSHCVRPLFLWLIQGVVIWDIPTPVTKTQAWGGCGALLMALASIWVVSKRLLRTSFWKVSFHLQEKQKGNKPLNTYTHILSSFPGT